MFLRKICDNITWGPIALGFLFFLIFGYIVQHPLKIHHDVALLLQTGELLWSGQMPYVDFIELDPPMIMYLNILPVLFEKVFSINSITILALLVALLVSWSALSMRKTLSESRLPISANDIYALVLCFVLFSIFILRNNEWGNRDHLFIVAFVPFLILRYVRNEEGSVATWRAIVMGVMAGIFSVFKQYYVLIVFAPEIYYLIKNRSLKKLFSPEMISLVTLYVTYALHFLLLPREMTEAYFDKWIPMLMQNYDLYDMTYANMIRVNEGYLFTSVSVLLFSLAFLNYFKTSLSRLLGPVIMAFVAAVIVFFLQHKGWRYQLIPAMGLFSVAVGVIVAEFFQRVGSPLKVVFCSLLCISSLIVVFRPHDPIRLGPLEPAISTYTKERDRVMIVSTSVGYAYPILMQMKRQPGTRYLTSFPIAFFQKNSVPKEEKQFVDELLADVEIYRPPLILVDNTEDCQACPKDFTIYQYLEGFGFQDEVLRHYTRQQDIAGFAVFSRSEAR